MAYYPEVKVSQIEEFQNLRQSAQITAQQLTFESALDPVNYRRNRYRDVLANDNTRVRLGLRAGSDYINANFIGGFEGTSTLYIACQAPLPATYTDFWRMIWEQSVPIIVMLTPLVEKSRIKAHQYWPGPGETERHGPYTVRSQSTTIYKAITIRKFWLLFEDQTREIVQLHYEEWKDMSVPERPTGILTLVDVTHKFLKRSGTRGGGGYLPVAVHCSAGIGRTGTFIGLDIAMQQYQNLSHFSIPEIVRRMREQRFGMVQTEEQYLFIYKALEEWLSRQPRPVVPIQPTISSSFMPFTSSLTVASSTTDHFSTTVPAFSPAPVHAGTH